MPSRKTDDKTTSKSMKDKASPTLIQLKLGSVSVCPGRLVSIVEGGNHDRSSLGTI